MSIYRLSRRERSLNIAMGQDLQFNEDGSFTFDSVVVETSDIDSDQTQKNPRVGDKPEHDNKNIARSSGDITSNFGNTANDQQGLQQQSRGLYQLQQRSHQRLRIYDDQKAL
ncbi:hypothetical protein BGX27_010007 [Mortierella sp. AM989]|nr:hypothetical protein BGX27_010007 [Mortierella sp. AM989]